MKHLRDYQISLADKCYSILSSHGFVYLAAEVRTGKSATSLEICRLFGAKNVLFLTKKKAIKSIESDYIDFGFDKFFLLTVTNDESMHKVTDTFDLVIHDEHHRYGAFPKPGKYCRMFKEKYGHLPTIFLSGTPVPESPSQWYHQFWCIKRNPFQVNNFYGWFKAMGCVKKEFDLGFGMVANYHNTKEVVYKWASVQKRELSKNDSDYDAKLKTINDVQEQGIIRQEESESKIKSIVDNFLVTFTQQEAGFSTSVAEKVHYVKMDAVTYKIASRLKKDRVVQGSDEVILADTAVKMMGKLLQIFSGTVIFESGSGKVIDTSKANYIRKAFDGERLGIFYKFQQEWNMLKSVFGDDLTNDIEKFDNGIKHIALQYLSGREGVSLKNADELIFITPDFSATTYFQARDRLTHKDRTENTLHWILSDRGIDKRVYEVVKTKKSYTTSIFNKDEFDF